MLIIVDNKLLHIRPQQVIISSNKLENKYLADITPKPKKDVSSKKTDGSRLRSKPKQE